MCTHPLSQHPRQKKHLLMELNCILRASSSLCLQQCHSELQRAKEAWCSERVLEDCLPSLAEPFTTSSGQQDEKLSIIQHTFPKLSHSLHQARLGNGKKYRGVRRVWVRGCDTLHQSLVHLYISTCSLYEGEWVGGAYSVLTTFQSN